MEEKQELLEIKKTILSKAKKNKVSSSVIDKIIEDLDDESSQELFDWLNEQKIDYSTDLDDEEFVAEETSDNSELDDVEHFDEEDPELEETINKVDLSSYENDLAPSGNVRINDPVKMYLKEIGRVNLLNPEDEPEIARRIKDGEHAYKKLADKYQEDSGERILDDDGKRLIEDEAFLLKAVRYYKKDPDEALINKYIATINDGNEAKRILISANLRLVVSIAKKYVGRGMLFLDLIQEGNMGLVKAVEKFDYTKGFKFSTYATWWIRQAITRAIADQARTIRIPVHMVETINKLTRIQRQLVQTLDREPTAEEIAEAMGNGITPEKVREIQKIALDPVSLETPIGEEDDSHLGDFIEDKDAMSPDEYANNQLLKNEIKVVLEGLTDREEKVLALRFGLEDGRTRTLEEVGKEFNVTRERIRQIEAKALRKLKHPSRSKRLRDFIDKS